MNVVAERQIDDHLTVKILEHAGLDEYLIVEINGILDGETSGPCFEFINTFYNKPKGVVFLMGEFKYTNATGLGHFVELLKRNGQDKKYTILIGLPEYAHPLFFELLQHAPRYLIFKTLEDFLLHLRTHGD